MYGNVEISWILEGMTPDQIPMSRLAEYIHQFAILLGDDPEIRLARIDKGSTKLVASLPGKAAGKAQSRLYAYRDRRPIPMDAARAGKRINDMVGEVRKSARITIGTRAIVRFSGTTPDRPKSAALVDTGTITGRLYGLLETPSGSLNVRIRPRNGVGYVNCTADAVVARKLRDHFGEAVRVVGRGTWTRSEDGEWACQSMHILEVEGVRDVSLRDAINALRAIQTDWPDDPLGDWASSEEDKDTAA